MQKIERILFFFLLCQIIPFVARTQDSPPNHPVDGSFITEWLLLGPLFPDDLATEFIGDEASIDARAGDVAHTSRGDTVAWRRYRSRSGLIDLRAAIGKHQHATAYAFCTLASDSAQHVRFRLGSNDGAAAWINGSQVHRNPVHRWLTLDEDTFEAVLQPGANRCLVKITQGVGSWGFSMRASTGEQPAPITPSFFLSLDDLPYGLPLSKSLWRYQPGDDTAWAEPDLNDSTWMIVKPELSQRKPPLNAWNGIGWFRLHLVVDSTLWNRPLALQARQLGAASEVFLDGVLVAQFGKIGSSSDDEQGYIVPNANFLPPPKSIVFSRTQHLIAVRLSNFNFTEIFPGQWQGFGLSLEDLNSAISSGAHERSANVMIQMAVTIIPLVFAILHLLLFAFYRRAPENLYYALFTFLLGITLFSACQIGFSLVTALQQSVLYIKLTQVFIPLAFVAGLRFLYEIFYRRLPRQFWLFLFLSIVWGMWQWHYLFSFWQVGTALMIAMLFEMLRIAVVAIRRRKEGAWIIGTGFIVFVAGFLCGILAQIGILPINFDFMNAFYLSGLVGLLLSMSVFLARNISRTEAENARKSRELEAARELQLSMLPATIPSHPDCEIAIYMQTATEVGGDYYDFKLHDDGTLTAVIGDATGHGMQAGTMVSATKSLFHALADEPAPVQILRKGTEAIRAMGLRRMYMALTIAKFRDHHMQIAAAGMPYPLVYRASTGQVEELALKGMPLGGFANFPYKERSLPLHRGDTVLLMSDGLEEMFNRQDQILGDAAVKQLFTEIAGEAPEKIIAHLKKAGEVWADGRAQQDDVTFIVIKIKN